MSNNREPRPENPEMAENSASTLLTELIERRDALLELAETDARDGNHNRAAQNRAIASGLEPRIKAAEDEAATKDEVLEN